MQNEFSKAAASYDEAAVLAAEVGRRMADRLDYVKLTPERVADIGCATGDGIRELARRYPKALPVAIDYALPMLHQVRSRVSFTQRLRGNAPRLINGDVNALPLRDTSLGLVWSDLVLHWLADPLPAFRELHRTLEVGGLLTMSLLGPDTLKEIRAACVTCGIEPPLHRFHDMHDIGDMLIAAGFADPVMDMEYITLTYRTPRGLLRDQRHLGVRDALFGKLSWRDWRRVFNAWRDGHTGDLSVTFEIVYGHAWKPTPKALADGRAIVHFTKK